MYSHPEIETSIKMMFYTHSIGLNDGINNLRFFKSDIEKSLTNDNFSDYEFITIEIPKIDICISVPLDIGDISPLYNVELPSLPTCFINIFPKNDKSYVICGYHKIYNSQWIINFIKRIQSTDNETIYKEISDLITYRLEFWAMSPKLFKSIEQKKFDEFKKLIFENTLNFDEKINSTFNLFK